MLHKRIGRFILVMCIIFLVVGLMDADTLGIIPFNSAGSVFFGTIVFLWGASFYQRIIDRDIRWLLYAIAGFLTMLFFFQLCKYRLLAEDSEFIYRFCGYAYYVSYISIPLLIYFISARIYRDYRPLGKQKWILTGICALLILLVLTNEYHGLVFEMQNFERRGMAYRYHLAIILIYLWMGCLYISFLILTVKKCRVVLSRRYAYVPLIFAAVGSLGMILTALDVMKMIGGRSFWNTGQFFMLSIVGFIESSIQLGMIPANQGYRRLFALTNQPVIINENDRGAVYVSPRAMSLFDDSENVRVFTKEISGGSVSWAVDFSSINELNRQMMEVTEKIQSRNRYLKEENRLKEEHSSITARNNLYDGIAQIVKPQLMAVQEKMEDSEADESHFRENLAQIAVLNAYIKRRSNMELMKNDSGLLSVRELFTAISESCEYLKLCGAETLVRMGADSEKDADSIIRIYEFFEFVLEREEWEENSLMVRISGGDFVTLSMMFTGKNKNLEEELSIREWQKENGRMEFLQDENEVTIVFAVKGGASDETV